MTRTSTAARTAKSRRRPDWCCVSRAENRPVQGATEALRMRAIDRRKRGRAADEKRSARPSRRRRSYGRPRSPCGLRSMDRQPTATLASASSRRRRWRRWQLHLTGRDREDGPRARRRDGRLDRRRRRSTSTGTRAGGDGRRTEAGSLRSPRTRRLGEMPSWRPIEGASSRHDAPSSKQTPSGRPVEEADAAFGPSPRLRTVTSMAARVFLEDGSWPS